MWLFWGGLSGFAAVFLGAFGAHGLERQLAEVSDFERRMDWWSTASHYHLVHALLLVLVALLIENERIAPGPLRVSGVALLVGTVLFSGSLYLMTLTGWRALGAITPLGGVSFLVAWGALVYAGWTSS